MTRDETIALFLRGRDAWNDWAGKLLALRRAMEQDGGWLAETDWQGTLEAKNEKTSAWLEAAKADFSEAGFETAAWPKMQPSARTVPLETNRVDFDGFIFPGAAAFGGAIFAGDASFRGAIFAGTASFERAGFSGDAWFNGAVFSAPASFYRASFNGHAWFEDAAFQASVSFGGALFRRAVSFHGAAAARNFSLAGADFLRHIPDFTTVTFAKPALLDGAEFAPGMEPGLFIGSILGRALLWMTGQLDGRLAAKYRVLKQFARDQSDRSKQQFFFRGELRARRYTEDMPWHPAFWLGILYELFSGFGRSLALPVLWLLALSLVSSWFYLDRHGPAKASPRALIQERIVSHLPAPLRPLLAQAKAKGVPTPACKEGKGDPVKAALQLALRQSSVIGAFDGQSSQIYACLYGFDETLVAPVVPGAVGLWGIGQAALAALLWFLFVLALRNQFRMK